MKTIKTIVAAALVSGAVLAAGCTSSGPTASDGLFTLATTGAAADYAKETGGMAYDKTGGNPSMFTYEVDSSWQVIAAPLLNKGEFLAPHFSLGPTGTITVMIAPHHFVDGEVIKGAGPDDNFIVITDGVAKRFDYSDDVA